MVRIGVLALQGDVAEHRAMLTEVGADVVAVKRAEQLGEIDGLIIPGGESTTIGRLLRRFDMLQPLRHQVEHGLPVYGTCAGMILLADEVVDGAADQPTVGGIDVTVQRNAFGRQRESFETDLAIPAVGAAPLHAVFIRAPLITRVGERVQVLASLPDGRAVAARQGSVVVSSFHPELTDDSRVHRYFVRVVEESRSVTR
jgi:pyridoxal 5'-phosphate synthase pdxT subunit